LALALLTGSLWLSLGMGLKACPLCYYQRTFVMGVVGVLGVGLLLGAHRSLCLPLLALPAAVGGCGVAAYHVSRELAGAMECPAGLLGLGTAPQQSLAGFALLLIVLGLAAWKSPSGSRSVLPAAASAVVLGALFSVGAVWSTASIPLPPEEMNKQAPDICRPVKKPAS
jgi:disulfide bond formation protein DsbB